MSRDESVLIVLGGRDGDNATFLVRIGEASNKSTGFPSALVGINMASILTKGRVGVSPNMLFGIDI